MGITYHEDSNIFHLYTRHTSYQIVLYQGTYPVLGPAALHGCSRLPPGGCLSPAEYPPGKISRRSHVLSGISAL